MKKILFALMFSMFLFACDRPLEDARKVKVGMSGNELKYVMGEPWSVEVETGYEVWYFTYSSNGYKKGLHVTVVNDKVTDFYSY